jgi:hypothetical protein
VKSPLLDDWLGSYIRPIDKISEALNGEFDDFEQNVKSYLQLEVVEMTEEEYEQLPEFKGY